MMNGTSLKSIALRSSRARRIYALASCIGLILLLMWMQDAFEHKVGPGVRSALVQEAPAVNPTVRVIEKHADAVYAWPGTVAARIVARIAPKLGGRILEINVRSGDRIKRGQILARLDDTEMRARLDQARSALHAADAEAMRASADARRFKNLFGKQAATRQDLELAVAKARSGKARLMEAREVVREVESRFDEMILKAPFDGVVVERRQEPGDTALPGSPVLIVQQFHDLRIESAVPAHCAGLIKLGDELALKIANSEKELNGTVDEIQPAADPETRTVLIKLRLPPDSGAQPGAFAWLYQACGQRRVLLVPVSAVKRIGQLESVRLVVAGETRLRHVRTGKRYGAQVEVLSGLKQGDQIRLSGTRP
jgi:RND family efflux transporter MFP subunit